MLTKEWQTALDDWRRYQIMADMAESSRALRRRHLTWLAEYVQPLGPWQVTVNELARFAEEHEHWGRETKRSWRTSLTTFYGWAIKSGRTTVNPALDTPRVRTGEPNPHPTPNAAYLKAIRSAPPRERVMARLAGECSLRRSEVAKVHRDDIVEDGTGYSLRVRGKGDRVRLVPLPATLLHELRVLCMAGGGYAFPGRIDGHLSAAYVGKVVKRLLPAGYTMHSLRHRGATMMYAETGGDLFLTQRFLGHSSPATTQLYVATDRSAMRAAVERIARAG